MLKIKRILVPVDFTPESELALAWAIRLAKEEKDATIELCHVLPRIPAPVGPEALAFEYSDYFQDEKKAMEKKLKKLLSGIPRPITCSYLTRQGHVPDEIARICVERAMDLVIMTTRGRRGLSHIWHGSTSEETVRLAPCPVLVLHLNRQTETTNRMPGIRMPAALMGRTRPS